MPFDTIYQGVMYGPTGPETRRWKDDTWGPTMEKAMAGNDNENVLEKTRILGKYTFHAATLFFISDVMMLNNKGGIPNAIARMKFHYGPWMGATVAYTAGVATACSLRGGKSDHKNHVVGGFAAGAVVGKFAKSGITGFLSGAFLAAMGWIYKDSAIHGYDLFGRIDPLPPKHGHPWAHKSFNLTTIRERMGDRPGYWCRSPDEVEKVYKQGLYGDGNTTDKHW